MALNYGTQAAVITFTRDPEEINLNHDIQYGDLSSIAQNLIRESYCSEVEDATNNGDQRREEALVLSPVEDNHASLFSTDVGAGFFFERIWIYPREFDYLFITEDISEEIKIWNAYRAQTATVSAISVVDEDGTLLEYPSLPDTIPIFSDAIYDLTVYGDGPPKQNTTYTITINSVEYTITITGDRIIEWDLDPNWDRGVKIKYEFASAVWTNDKFGEQRRPMSDESWAHVGGSYDISDDRNRTIINRLGYGKARVFGVPLFSEKLKPSNAGIGETTVTVEEDPTYYYNLNSRVTHIALVDHANGVMEIKELSNISGSDIELAQPIYETFDVDNTFLYPCIFAVLSNLSVSHITDDMDEIKIDFREYKGA